jgi:hypothetical protein
MQTISAPCTDLEDEQFENMSGAWTVLVIVVLSAVAMVGCSSYSSNMMVGRDVSYVSLAEQRAAATGVQVLAQAPQGGKSLGLVDAIACSLKRRQMMNSCCWT